MDQQFSNQLQLTRYLKEYISLRTKVVREFDKYESVLWFHNLPKTSDCICPLLSGDNDLNAPILEIHKQKYDDLPEPPPDILDWIDESKLAKPAEKLPDLDERIFPQKKDESNLDDGLVEIYLSDHPEVLSKYESYRPSWESWSVKRLKQESVQRVYEDLFSLYTQMLKQNEIVEVVLSFGLLQWKPSESSPPVNRHTFVANIDLEFVAEKGVMRVIPSGNDVAFRVEDDMLEAYQRPDASAYELLHKMCEDVGENLNDRIRISNVIKTWGNQVSPEIQWDGGNKPSQKIEENSSSIVFAPALVLRKRNLQGMRKIYEDMEKELSESQDNTSLSWEALTSISLDSHFLENGNNSGQDGARFVDDEVYFPLPSNREQKRIVEAINKQKGVLVQGPPGTGKSHTIANLMSHLLATGQRILITAETSRALNVLKDKLPESIQPLCVSLLGQNSDAFSELNKAVQGITTRQSAYSSVHYKDQIHELEQDLDNVRRRLATARSDLRSIRSGEVEELSLSNGAYRGTPTDVARKISDDRIRYDWIELPESSPDQPTVGKDDLLEWYSCSKQLMNLDELPDGMSLPPLRDMIEPEVLFELCQKEEKLKDAINSDLEQHSLYSIAKGFTPDERKLVYELLADLDGCFNEINLKGIPWLLQAIGDLQKNNDTKWSAIRIESQRVLANIELARDRIEGQDITIPESRDVASMRSDAAIVYGHLADGGKWKKLGTTPKKIKGKDYFLSEVLVNSEPADDARKMGLVCDYLDILKRSSVLASLWGEVGVSISSNNILFMTSELTASDKDLDRIFGLVEKYNELSTLLYKGLQNHSNTTWFIEELPVIREILDGLEIEQNIANIQEPIDRSIAKLRSFQSINAEDEFATALIQSLRERDVSHYSRIYRSIANAQSQKDVRQNKNDLGEKIASKIPGLLEKIEDSFDDDLWLSRIGEIESAWSWHIAYIALSKRSDCARQAKLIEKEKWSEAEELRLLGEIASLKAWAHFFNRLSEKESQALKGWSVAVKSLGKGKGKSNKVHRIRREARTYLEDCRYAIPIWIMPRYLVADMVSVKPEMFDVVIVDEASQLGIDGLFLFYMAKNIVVVGDDQQISPYGIGINDDDVHLLQRLYAKDLPHKHALYPQSSLYSNAKIRFNSNIVLREHFRCMPEIIQFSNDLCYAPNGTPLDPIRSFSPDRLKPLEVRHVVDGYRKGTSGHAQNPPEATAIIDQIKACIGDPRYSNKTIGVISLLGTQQSKRIEYSLYQEIDLAEIERRRLICGDAYTFQGDERDVIFLSMVAAPGEVRLKALTRESDKQRFNVAVSRAKEQLWLYHTATLEDLSDKCLRYKLLKYMRNPVRSIDCPEEAVFESDFERQVYETISRKGYRVRTQVAVGDRESQKYRIDLVVEGIKGRLAVECDGDRWHGPDRWDADMARQRDLERVGWQFFRIKGGDFYHDKQKSLEPLWVRLRELGIEPCDFGEVPEERVDSVREVISGELSVDSKSIETVVPLSLSDHQD